MSLLFNRKVSWQRGGRKGAKADGVMKEKKSRTAPMVFSSFICIHVALFSVDELRRHIKEPEHKNRVLAAVTAGSDEEDNNVEDGTKAETSKSPTRTRTKSSSSKAQSNGPSKQGSPQPQLLPDTGQDMPDMDFDADYALAEAAAKALEQDLAEESDTPDRESDEDFRPDALSDEDGEDDDDYTSSESDWRPDDDEGHSHKRSKGRPNKHSPARLASVPAVRNFAPSGAAAGSTANSTTAAPTPSNRTSTTMPVSS